MSHYHQHHDEAADYSRMIDAAKVRAHQLQSEAIAEFFAGIGHSTRNAARAANRFAHSLTRHSRLRNQECA